jgi:glycosyltransferase involved in cell wall biosynthesis
LAAALERLKTDSELRARMGRAARAHAQASFGVDRMLDAMETVFQRVAAERR